MDAGSIIILVAIAVAALVAAGMLFLSPRRVDSPDTEALKELFSTTAYDDENHLFLLMPDAMGFGFVMSPIAGADSELQEKLNSLLSLTYPANAILQCAMWKSPDIEPLLDAYVRLRRGAKHPQIKDITQQRVDFLREGTRAPLDPSSNITLHDTKVIFTVRVPVGSGIPSQDKIDRIADLQKAVAQSLKSSGFWADPLDAETWLRIVQTIFNQGESASWRHSTSTQVEPSQFLQHQVLDPNVDIRVTPKAVYLGEDLQARTLMIKRFPEATYFGMALKYLADIGTGTRGIRNNCLITLNMVMPDQEEARKQLERNQLIATKQAEGLITRYSPMYRQRKESLDLLAKAAGEGDAILSGYLGMAVFARNDDEAIAAVNNARAYWRELGFQLMPDEHFVLPLLMQLVPFGATEAMKAASQRYRTMTSRNAVTLMPALGSWQGSRTPHLTLVARDGQLMRWSPFDADNYGVTVSAASGSGKSFLVNALTLSILSVMGRVWIIDVGNSYLKLCEMLGGQYLRFDKSTRIGLNPFPLVADYNDEADMLATIVALMAAPKGKLDDYQWAGLKRHMAEGYAEHRGNFNIDLLSERMKADPDRRIVDIGQQLFSFTSQGEFGSYFNGPNTFEQTSDFMVLELGELKGQPHLQQVVLFQLMYQINKQMYHGDLDQKKMMVVDEAWDLLGHEVARDFIVTAYRRARKVNGSPVCISQSQADFYMNPGTSAIADNSANKLLLKQNKESINALQKDGRLPFGEWGYAQLRSVHTVQGSYSEVMVSTDAGAGVGRLIVSDFEKLLYTTKPAELAMIEAYKKQGMTTMAAIHAILEQRRRKAA